MEPWVNLENESNFFHWTLNDTIASNQRLRQKEKAKAFSFFFDMIYDNGINGDYLEFGCHRVRTFRMALTEARKRGSLNMRFYAFDSFDGLPDLGVVEGVHPKWQKGALSTTEDEFWRIVKNHGIYLDKIHTIKGFYSTSLNDDRRQQLLLDGVKASLINIDCDLYESARDAFDFCKSFLQEGTCIYVDDFFSGYKSNSAKGVGKSLKEFAMEIESLGWQLVPHIQVGWWGRSFIVSSIV